MQTNWANKNITILGFSKSGIASAEFLSKNGANCTISDKKEQKTEDNELINKLNKLGIKVELGCHNAESIKNADIILTSPGIPPYSEVIILAKKYNKEIISELDAAYLSTEKPFIAITGTNGKTTVTKLVSEIFENAGYKAPACGNIGIPVISQLQNNPDYFIVEISSYQIDTSKYFKPKLAAYLNYTPDHIDWHGSEEEYFKAKSKLFLDDKTLETVVLNATDKNISTLIPKIKSEIIYFNQNKVPKSVYISEETIIYHANNDKKEIIKLNEIPLIGNHNYQNVMAAIAIAVKYNINPDSIKETIKSFKSPEHRIEYIETIDNIKYYNDSKATNPESCICAINAFNENIALIAGGKDKGTPLDELVKTISQKVKKVILIGEASERFAKALKDISYENIHFAENLEDAINKASSTDVTSVLFSPACASFDMFKNYEERGNEFKKNVFKKKQTSKS